MHISARMRLNCAGHLCQMKTSTGEFQKVRFTPSINDVQIGAVACKIEMKASCCEQEVSILKFWELTLKIDPTVVAVWCMRLSQRWISRSTIHGKRLIQKVKPPLVVVCIVCDLCHGGVLDDVSRIKLRNTEAIARWRRWNPQWISASMIGWLHSCNKKYLPLPIGFKYGMVKNNK